jgi:hypothetical protein
MSSTWVNRVGMVTLVGVMVLSIGLMADRALAEKGDKDDKGSGSAMDLSGVTQNWDKNLPSTTRFTVLAAFGGAAVRDNNTGLVWEQAPDTTTTSTWYGMTRHCVNKPVGGTRGWRLPSVVELLSVQDLSVPSPYINSVFNSTGILSANWWSATATPANSTDAWSVSFGSGEATGYDRILSNFHAWCVRGPMNADMY